MSVGSYQTTAYLLYRIWDVQTNTQNETKTRVTVSLCKLSVYAKICKELNKLKVAFLREHSQVIW